MLSKLKKYNKVFALGLIILAVLSLGSVYLFQDNRSVDLKQARVYEFTSSENVNSQDIRHKFAQASFDAEIGILEANQYRVIYSGQVSDETIKEMLSDVKASETEDKFYTSFPIFDTNLIKNSIMMGVSIIIIVSLYSILPKMPISRISRLTLIKSVFVRFLLEGILVFGTIFALANLDIFALNSSLIEISLGMIFLSLIFKIAEYHHFTTVYEEIQGKTLSEKFASFTEKNSIIYMIANISVLVMISGLLLSMSVREYYFLIIVVVGVLINLISIFIISEVLIAFFEKYLPNLKFIKKSKFWRDEV